MIFFFNWNRDAAKAEEAKKLAAIEEAKQVIKIPIQFKVKVN